MKFRLLMAFAFLSWISSGVVAQGIENKGADNKGTEKKDVNKKWELGLGLGSLYGPDYRGADEYRSYTAAIPYVIYRGKYIRSDREGVRGNFFHSDNLEFSLSASANVTPDADKNKARTGMPKLGSTAELGPSFNIRLTGPSLRQGLQLQLPWRAVFALGDDDSGYMGQVFQPQLLYRQRLADWNLSYRLGLSFADEKYQDHYYQVDPIYATEARPAFDAAGGYSGWSTQVAGLRALDIWDKQLRLALFARYDQLDNSQISGSPLAKSQQSWRLGAAIIWVIK